MSTTIPHLPKPNLGIRVAILLIILLYEMNRALGSIIVIPELGEIADHLHSYCLMYKNYANEYHNQL